MKKFKYCAHALDGTENIGTILATDQMAAITQLRNCGIFPAWVIPKEQKNSNSSEKTNKETISDTLSIAVLEATPISTNTLIIYTSQLATLLHSGLSLLHALRTLYRQNQQPVMKHLINDLCESIENGCTFTEAICKHPKTFNSFYIGLVRAGEVSGKLDLMLERIAEHMDQTRTIKNTLIGALIYPVITLFFSLFIVGFELAFLIPRFERMFTDLLPGKSLPVLTQRVIQFGEFTCTHYVSILGTLGSLMLITLLAQLSKKMRYYSGWLQIKIPIFGSLLHHGMLSRISRTLGTLLDSGVPVIHAIRITQKSIRHEPLKQAMRLLSEAVNNGEPITNALDRLQIFPSVFSSMVEVGEEAGTLPDMLIKTADFYDKEVKRKVNILTPLIDPLVIVLLAGIIGTIVVALFLPLVTMINYLG